MNWPDVVMALVLVAGLPLYVARFRFPRLKRAIAGGDTGARLRAYREGILMQWALLAFGVVIWMQTHPPGGDPRSLSELGLGFWPGFRWWIGLGATAVIAVVLWVQRVQVMRNREEALKLKDQLTHVGPLMPQTRVELAAFKAIAVTAGICEETLYRGFLIGVLLPFTGVWGAVALSTVFFGLGHAYQGLKGIVQTLIVGLVLAVLFVFTQSLWLPIALHAFLDWNSGVIAHHVLTLEQDRG